ncbi:MAG: prepilin-type N-terminal cleavage/methylation domain-containing protein [Lentisphaeria bacterium]|nr:prepilin-type N-terminal cleavage/methylation domain-containing protein [Lentisphaeria bacterium]
MARPRFTLIEVLVAVAVLALALGATLALSGQAKFNIATLESEWALQHALEQATEFYLLTPDPVAASLPDGLIPRTLHASCEIYVDLEGLPDYAQEASNGWILGTYRIVVTDEGGRSVEHIVNKLIFEEDAE